MWDKLNKDRKEEYQTMILAFASLTELFSQKSNHDSTPIPIINSKFQETIFQKVFGAKGEDISNKPFDVSLKYNGTNFLIGIKTFQKRSRGFQKVAQFKRMRDDWKNLTAKKKAEEIKKARNTAIASQKALILGPNSNDAECVYHYLMTSVESGIPRVTVGEADYREIGENINIKSTGKNGNFTFSDGDHDYKYTDADCQLWMSFPAPKEGNEERWEVKYAEDAFTVFKRITENTAYKPNQTGESYCWKINVQKYSGYNNFYSTAPKSDKKKKANDAISCIQKSTLTKNKKVKLIELINTFAADSKVKPDTKAKVRANIEEILKDIENEDIKSNISKLLWRGDDEVYIPIPSSRKFHNDHQDFFGGETDGFKLVLEPSGNEIDCYITQSDGKGIQSKDNQSVLGRWILRDVFQLKEHEPLTEKRLEEIGINAIKFTKKDDKKIHCSFVWVDQDDPDSDEIINWPPKNKNKNE